MGYKYDIFISYKHGHATEWIHKLLLQCLKVQVEFFLGREPIIFTDRDIESGASWPLVLKKALSESRSVIPIFQPTYFESEWCKKELTVILKREEVAGFRTPTNPLGLTLPITIGDGTFFPSYAKDIQWIDCSSYYTQCSATAYKDTKEYREFEKYIQSKSNDIANVIASAPKWKSAWEKLSIATPPVDKKPKKTTAPLMA